ncbi:unnamed protein product, partial [Prorocentrum cordatum]
VAQQWEKPARKVPMKFARQAPIADESLLSQNKPGKLNKAARPKKGNIWMWGAVLQGGLAQNTLRRGLVDSDDGEIVNARGFTIDAIESKWGILKRWLKAKYGGKLLNYADRVKWRYAINEYQARCYLSMDHALMGEKYYYVPLAK